MSPEYPKHEAQPEPEQEDQQLRTEAALQQARDGRARGDQARDGDDRGIGERAFAEIVYAHQAMVFSIAWHFLADRSLAEDLAQDVFLDLYRRLGDIRSAAHLVHWLRRTAVHRCLDQGRRRKVRREVPFDAALEEAALDGALKNAPAAAANPLEDSLLSERLRRTVAELPEKQRIVVLLRYQEDLEPAEIAELLEMPVNTVKSLLQRALEKLRGKLERQVKEARYAFL